MPSCLETKNELFLVSLPFLSLNLPLFAFLVLPHSLIRINVYVISTLASNLINSCLLCLFWINYNFVLKSCKISGFLNFHFSHLIYENFNLYLQNTLNMWKTTRVYFGVLHLYLAGPQYEEMQVDGIFGGL